MAKNKADDVLFAYFERPVREYVRILKSVKAAGGLNNEEIDEIRAKAPTIHADTILRRLATGNRLPSPNFQQPVGVLIKNSILI